MPEPGVGLSEEEADLLSLAENLDEEECTAAQEMSFSEGESKEEDDVEDWVDEVEALTQEERELLDDDIRPIKMVLVKVSVRIPISHSPEAKPVLQLRKLAFKIVHSSTILLPAWKACLEKLKLPLRIMSRDVTTRWNSTYDMLTFVVTYRKAVELFMSERKNDLRAYELKEKEWAIVVELCGTLKVRHCVAIPRQTYLTTLYRFSKMLQPTSHALHPTCQL